MNQLSKMIFFSILSILFISMYETIAFQLYPMILKSTTSTLFKSTILSSSSSSDKNEEELNNSEISRYSRHLVLKDVGMKGQTKLKNSSVLVIGAGGLGSPCLMYLAAAGVGHIGIVVRTSIYI